MKKLILMMILSLSTIFVQANQCSEELRDPITINVNWYITQGGCEYNVVGTITFSGASTVSDFNLDFYGCSPDCPDGHWGMGGISSPYDNVRKRAEEYAGQLSK
jgi:hypothetical protein